MFVLIAVVQFLEETLARENTVHINDKLSINRNSGKKNGSLAK